MGAKTRILIVDDDPKFRKSLTDILGAKGYAPIATAKGRAALEIVEEGVAVVALIDLKLEDMSGLELIKELKECSPGTECILITGYASKGSAIEAVNLGAYGYMRKPYDMEQLLVTIRRAIEKREAEETLKKSEEKFRILFEDSRDAILITDQEGKFIDVNQSCLDLFGYTMEGMMSLNFNELYNDPLNGKKFLQEINQKDFLKDYETKLRKKDGSEMDCLFTVSTRRAHDRSIIGYQGIIRDITERMKAEEQIKASLKEKEALLSEIHHRVKNNMQVISSLLRVQADKIQEKEYADMFKESNDRIRSMALVHEKLYQSEDFANVDFNGYVKSLVNGLFRSYGIDTNKIALKMEIEDVSLGVDTAVPCGLLINELVSNSLKYAFTEGREGEIGIALRSINEDELELIVSDDGIGIPQDLDIKNTESFGLELISILAEDQLDGQIELDRTAGTRYQIRLKRQKYRLRI